MGNGVYVFVLSGSVTVNGELLENRDGLGISETEVLTIVANTESELLLIDIPMDLA